MRICECMYARHVMCVLACVCLCSHIHHDTMPIEACAIFLHNDFIYCLGPDQVPANAGSNPQREQAVGAVAGKVLVQSYLIITPFKLYKHEGHSYTYSRLAFQGGRGVPPLHPRLSLMYYCAGLYSYISLMMYVIVVQPMHALLCMAGKLKLAATVLTLYNATCIWKFLYQSHRG